mmetsp:Transcript_24710/g.43543  ORF Transcript_24710/g.43543 Transcript_24710/m.43543 type:complete len:151 (+) Transcript_24710:141-593(+)
MRCVECSKWVDRLYNEVLKGHLALTNCEHCGKVADKYVEYEYTIIFLNLLLCKPQVYRHLLFNTDFCAETSHIALLFALSCVLSSILEVCHDFYCWTSSLFYSTLALSCYYGACYVLIRTLGYRVNLLDLMRAMVVSSFGKLGVPLMLVW